MARFEHYENGEWVGSTEVPNSSIESGWVHTYSADGKNRATYVSQNSTTYSSSNGINVGGGCLFVFGCVILLGTLFSIANPLIFFILYNRAKKSKPKFYKEEIVYKVSKILFVLQMITLFIFLIIFLCSIIFMPQIIDFIKQYK